MTERKTNDTLRKRDAEYLKTVIREMGSMFPIPVYITTKALILVDQIALPTLDPEKGDTVCVVCRGECWNADCITVNLDGVLGPLCIYCQDRQEDWCGTEDSLDPY